MTPRARMIIAIVVSLLVALAFFMLFIRPRQAELAEVRAEIEAEEARTSQLQAELRRLEELQANAPRLRAELSEIREFVPQDHEIANFIFLVQAAANASGVDFVQIQPELPEPPPEGASIAQVRVVVRTEGGYFSVQDFLRRLYALDRAVRVDQIAMDALGEGTSGVSATSDARIFFEPPAVPVADEDDAAADEDEDEEE